MSVCEFGLTVGELSKRLGNRLSQFTEWMNGQTLHICPEHGKVTPERDLARFLSFFKAPQRVETIRCAEGFHHHKGPHACDFDNHEQCPYWAQP